ncbi:hypothetical protein [Micromonospora sp. C32]|uniref:hypothetical protein n=1 Tax=unclassified Micromonospora TaxID=2617518 RepID=UPI001B3829EE|nr:hypothetical protein [Micromonospora sp. C32]MBQ1057230.1 hypothetical protein [Micromonospora sp. C32]
MPSLAALPPLLLLAPFGLIAPVMPLAPVTRRAPFALIAPVMLLAPITRRAPVAPRAPFAPLAPRAPFAPLAPRAPVVVGLGARVTVGLRIEDAPLASVVRVVSVVPVALGDPVLSEMLAVPAGAGAAAGPPDSATSRPAGPSPSDPVSHARAALSE